MRIKAFTKRFVQTVKDGHYTDGSGLWLDVRNGGKARSWSFRRGDRRISPPGGSAHHITIDQAQAFVRQCRDRLARDEDPFSARAQAKEAESESKLTFRDCFAEYCARKSKQDWGRQAQKLGQTVANNYINPSPFADLPVQSINHEHASAILEPTWLTTPVMAKRAAHTICGMFRWAKSAHRSLFGQGWENPFITTKDSPLATALQGQPKGGHREALDVEDIPKLIAHLRSPRYPRTLRHDPDLCTVSEAMEATAVGREVILKLIRQGKLPGAYKPLGREKQWLQSPWLIPVAELKKHIRLRHPITELAEIPIHAYVLLFIIFTAVRSDMAVHLRWDQVKREKNLIEYRDQHKTGRHSDRIYNVIITDGVTEILNAMESLQRRDNLKSEYVFVHGHTPFGLNRRLGETVNIHTVNSYLSRQLQWIGDIRNKDATTHGFRTTFPEWACNRHNYSYEMVKATLGHAVGRQEVDAAYFRKVAYLDQRREMMTKWEKYCLTLADKPKQKKVVRLVRKTAN